MSKSSPRILLLGAILFLTGCAIQFSPLPNTPSNETGQISVAVTFYPLVYFVKRVGGGQVNVTSIIPNGTEPHEFEPTPDDILAVHRAKLFVYNGAGLDPWAEKIASDPQHATVRKLQATDGITLLRASEGGEASDDEGQDSNHHDPHVWLDPLLSSNIVSRIENELRAIDPQHEEVYRNNARTVTGELSAIDSLYRESLASCRQRDVVTSHAAFGYVAKRYGFNQIAVSGLSPEEEPSLQRLQEISDTVKTKDIKFIFFETLVSPKLAQTLSDQTGAVPLVFNPVEGLTEDEIKEGKDYLSIMRENAANLKTALECS